MTFDEYIKYENTIERMGKAHEMSADMQEKWADKIRELRTLLTDKFGEYLEFWVTGGENNLTDEEKGVLGLFVKMRGAVARCVIAGDLEAVHTGLIELRFILLKFRGKEYAMPHFTRSEENGTERA